MSSFYLAARFSRRFELQGCRADLLRIGHVVTSRWIDQTTDDDEDECASRDIADIDIADGLILFTEPPRTPTRNGRFVEFGYGLANDKEPILIVGPVENVFCNLAEQFTTWPAALERLKQ